MFVIVMSLTVSVKEGHTVLCQTGVGAHPASYSMGTEFFPGSKVAGA